MFIRILDKGAFSVIIRLSICFLILYCLFIVIDLIMVAINKGIKKTQRNALNVPVATHLLCSFLTLIITIALVLNLVDFDASLMWFYILFGCAFLVSVPLMLWVVFWRIEWAEDKIYYRNLFGLLKKYDAKSVRLISRKQYTFIMHQDRKITDYNFMLLNVTDVKKFEAFIALNSAYKK